MSYNIIASRGFVKELKDLGKRYRSIKDDVAQLGEDIRLNPQLGTDLGDGLRKIRLAITSKGKGKSAGARVITYTVVTRVSAGSVVLVAIYDKSEQASMSKRDIVSRLKSEGFLG